MAFFRVTHWGPAVGIGATGATYAHVSAICKRNGPQNPYFVANELVAAEMGRILRLPVPPGFIVQDTNQVPYYSSLDFNLTGVALPPIIPANFIATFQADLAEIVVFDIFIANPDRHPGNLSADYANPAKFSVFDHSHALLGAGAVGTGTATLQRGQNSITVGANHAIISGVANEALLVRAIERVESIPDYFIQSVVTEAAQYGLTAQDATDLTLFLGDRRARIRQLISGNKNLFPAILQWQDL
jgi:hypothetical protein